MTFKRCNGDIYGVNLTAKEQAALKNEINRQLGDFTRGHCLEMEALVLWTLHEKYGFGVKRLRDFWDALMANEHDLAVRYERDQNDMEFYKKLVEYGIDLDEWR
jgi:hypothetical protein